MPLLILRGVIATEMRVEVQHAEDFSEPVLDETACTNWLAALGRELAVEPSGSVCIRVCAEAESQQLNAAYRDIDRPTNVLSFPAEITVGDPILGDLAICWPIVEREANEQGKPLDQHAAHLVIHGVLHLLGFDHVEEKDAQEMEALEVTILSGLGIANPYL
jgi:probable rRNA maturation factor